MFHVSSSKSPGALHPLPVLLPVPRLCRVPLLVAPPREGDNVRPREGEDAPPREGDEVRLKFRGA